LKDGTIGEQNSHDISLPIQKLCKEMHNGCYCCKGNLVAKQYLDKLRKEEVSIDWAHRVLITSIRQQRMLKMMAIADDRHFSYDDEIELVQFIASEMQKEGLDLNNEENLDSYLNTKFM